MTYAFGAVLFAVALFAVVLLHPIPLTIGAAVFLVWLLRPTKIWTHYRPHVFLLALAFLTVDSAFALQRVLFDERLPTAPSIAGTMPLPPRLVLVNIPCTGQCHQWLITGAVEEMVLVTTSRRGQYEPHRAVRYRAGWSNPGACSRESERAMMGLRTAERANGFCPLVEPADIPEQGTFVVNESFFFLSSEAARSVRPAFLAKQPPGRVIRFQGHEVQHRTASGIEVLAADYRYQAPGLLGLPPLIGCWSRDDLVTTIPPGDAGCGFWRLRTTGGNAKLENTAWMFDRAFSVPDRTFTPPENPYLRVPGSDG